MPADLLLPPADALRSATRFLQRGVRPDGTHEEGSEWEIASHQWGLFISWAYHHGVALPASLAPDRDGGSEHDLLRDATPGRWLKFTKPFGAGFTWEQTDGGRFARRPATPLEYLRRWRLLNRLFRGDVRLVGLSCLGRTQRIVISQEAPVGMPPTWQEIEQSLARHHGVKRWSPPLNRGDDAPRRDYRCGRLLVFDVDPAECARTASGQIVPYGANPQVLSRVNQQIDVLG